MTKPKQAKKIKRNNEVEESPSLLRLIWFIIKQTVRFYKWVAIGLFFLGIIIEILPIYTTYIGGRLLDTLITIIKTDSGLSSSVFLTKLLLLVGSMLLVELLRKVHSYLDAIWENNREVFHDNVVTKYSLTLEPQLLDNAKFAHLKNYIINNLWPITAVFEITRLLIANIPALLIAGSILFVYDFKLIFLIILSTIPTFLLRHKFGNRVWSIWETDSEDKVKYQGYIWPTYITSLLAFLEIKVFNYGNYLIQKATQINKTFINKIINNEKLRMLYGMFYSLVEYLFIAAAIYLAFVDVRLGIFTIGKFFFVYGLIFTFRERIYYLTKMITGLTSKKKLLASYYKFMTIKPKLKYGNIKLKGHKISIYLDNVWFKYPKTSEWVLKGVTLKINPTENVALVGRNGAGKTTLIKLLLRVYDPIKGNIFINGINLKDLNIDDYYKKIGLLGQNFNILNIPVKDNIIIGDVKRKFSYKNMIRATDLAKITDKINKLPRKFNTYLNRGVKNGAELSGGEWQRLAIARVFYKNPELILLDEPTSAIDALAEEAIFDNIYAQTKDKTVLIISHRFATVKKAERIFVLDKGKIIESGTHASLIKRKGLYHKMYKAQNK